MAERYSPEKATEGLVDTAAFIAVTALALFAFIGMFVTAPLRRK